MKDMKTTTCPFRGTTHKQAAISAALKRAFKATAARDRRANAAAIIEYNNAVEALSPEDLARYLAVFPAQQDPAAFIKAGDKAAP